MKKENFLKLVEENNWLNDCSETQKNKILKNVEPNTINHIASMVWLCTNIENIAYQDIFEVMYEYESREWKEKRKKEEQEEEKMARILKKVLLKDIYPKIALFISISALILSIIAFILKLLK